MRMQIEEKIRFIMKNCFEDRYEIWNVPVDAEFKTSGLNSIDFIKLIVEIEKMFGFVFDDDHLDANNYGTLNELINYIELKVS